MSYKLKNSFIDVDFYIYLHKGKRFFPYHANCTRARTWRQAICLSLQDHFNRNEREKALLHTCDQTCVVCHLHIDRSDNNLTKLPYTHGESIQLNSNRRIIIYLCFMRESFFVLFSRSLLHSLSLLMSMHRAPHDTLIEIESFASRQYFKCHIRYNKVSQHNLLHDNHINNKNSQLSPCNEHIKPMSGFIVNRNKDIPYIFWDFFSLIYRSHFTFHSSPFFFCWKNRKLLLVHLKFYFCHGGSAGCVSLWNAHKLDMNKMLWQKQDIGEERMSANISGALNFAKKKNKKFLPDQDVYPVIDRCPLARHIDKLNSVLYISE